MTTYSRRAKQYAPVVSTCSAASASRSAGSCFVGGDESTRAGQWRDRSPGERDGGFALLMSVRSSFRLRRRAWTTDSGVREPPLDSRGRCAIAGAAVRQLRAQIATLAQVVFYAVATDSDDPPTRWRLGLAQARSHGVCRVEAAGCWLPTADVEPSSSNKPGESQALCHRTRPTPQRSHRRLRTRRAPIGDRAQDRHSDTLEAGPREKVRANRNQCPGGMTGSAAHHLASVPEDAWWGDRRSPAKCALLRRWSRAAALLETKLFVPRPRRGLVPRPRLSERLGESPLRSYARVGAGRLR